jgi:hypothetical protein
VEESGRIRGEGIGYCTDSWEGTALARRTVRAARTLLCIPTGHESERLPAASSRCLLRGGSAPAFRAHNLLGCKAVDE